MTWFVMIPPGYASKSTAEKDLVDFREEFTNPLVIAAVEAGHVINGSSGGDSANPQFDQQLVKWLGPFTTEAQAKAAQNPAQQSPNPANDAANAAENSVSNPLAFLQEVGDFFHRLTEASTWERIGEVLLGVALICVGVAKMTHAVPMATTIARIVEPEAV